MEIYLEVITVRHKVLSVSAGPTTSDSCSEDDGTIRCVFSSAHSTLCTRAHLWRLLSPHGHPSPCRCCWCLWSWCCWERTWTAVSGWGRPRVPWAAALPVTWPFQCWTRGLSGCRPGSPDCAPASYCPERFSGAPLLLAPSFWCFSSSSWFFVVPPFDTSFFVWAKWSEISTVV